MFDFAVAVHNGFIHVAGGTIKSPNKEYGEPVTSKSLSIVYPRKG